MNYKKGISPVVATALLLVVAVVAVVGFQGWFTTFSSNLFTKTETQSSSSIGNTQIESVQGYSLYFKNGNTENISINKIKVGDTDCNITGNYSIGISEIDLGSCLNNLTSKTQDVVVYTNNGIYSEKVYLKDIVVRVYSGCTLDSATVAHLGSYLFYNTSTVPFTGGNCSLNSLTRNCFDGTYSGNSSYQYASCSIVGQDITPNAFNFTNQTGVNLSTVITSNTLTPTGYEGSVSVGITGNGTPELSVGGGAWASSTTITLGQNITIRLNSSSSTLTASIATLSLGNYSVNWSVITRDNLNCSLNGTNVIHGNSYSFYNSSTVPYGSSCGLQERTCNNGVFNGTASYNISSCSVLTLNCSALGLAGGTWITVPGNLELNTSSFCVMKFEAKNVANVATSQTASTAWVSINQTDSKLKCESLGAKYHLITSAQWTTIARNAQNVSTNWNSSVVGSGFMFSGHNDNSPANALSVSNELDYYDQTSNSNSSGPNQKRVFVLNNSEIIWDFAGNIWEWNSDICNVSWEDTAGLYVQWTITSAPDLSNFEKIQAGPFGNYTSTNGVGTYYGCTNPGVNAFVRGGAWSHTTNAGAFNLRLSYPASNSNNNFGFRCVYTP